MSSVIIKNANKKEWDLMHPMCEMVADMKACRRMEPPLKFLVVGLDELKSYRIKLVFIRSLLEFDSVEKHFSDYRSTHAQETFTVKPKTGADWMKTVIDFSFLRISTRRREANVPRIKLDSHYVYYPKLIVTAVEDSSEVYEFSDDSLKFATKPLETSRIKMLKSRLNELRRANQSVESKKMKFKKRDFAPRKKIASEEPVYDYMTLRPFDDYSNRPYMDSSMGYGPYCQPHYGSSDYYAQNQMAHLATGEVSYAGSYHNSHQRFDQYQSSSGYNLFY